VELIYLPMAGGASVFYAGFPKRAFCRMSLGRWRGEMRRLRRRGCA